MAEYIEREALAEVAEQEGHISIDDILAIPAADVATLVRCKDCKHWHKETGYCDQHSYFIDSDGVSCSPAESPNWTMWDADDFCSDGERKDG